MHWYERAYGLRYASLRYFNAAGASEKCGEDHDPETHIIPITLQAAAGKRSHVEIYGDDYPTADGTCVRDYIHVIDLARAHILALGVLNERSAIYNLGCGGDGYSVRDVIDTARRVTGKDIPVRMGPRRAGRSGGPDRQFRQDQERTRLAAAVPGSRINYRVSLALDAKSGFSDNAIYVHSRSSVSNDIEFKLNVVINSHQAVKR